MNKNKIIKNIEYLFPLVVFVTLLVILYPLFSNLENKSLKENINIVQKEIDEENISDVDGDGLIDEIEFVLGTDAYSVDTDKDGYSDYNELKNGYNPFISAPNDKVDDDINKLVKDIVFENEDKKFLELDQLKTQLKNQSPNGLCDNHEISIDGLSNDDKMQRAIETKNPCICSLFLDDRYKNACYAELAGLTGNESLCKYIISGSSNTERAKSRCFHNLMLATLDEKYCYEISEEDDMASCFTALSLKTKRYNLCDLIENLDEKDKCYWIVAIFLKNKSLCEKISLNNINGNDREGCRDLIEFRK